MTTINHQALGINNKNNQNNNNYKQNLSLCLLKIICLHYKPHNKHSKVRIKVN